MSSGRRTGRIGGIELLARELADEVYRNTMETYDTAVGDSPIERLFCAALKSVAAVGHRQIEAVYALKQGDDLDYWRSVATSAGEEFHTCYLYPQVQTAGWRVDFVIHYPVFRNGPEFDLGRLLIECDGHEFHERTKEQAARDRSRDRAAQYAGETILRFTGSEIWNDPYGCADEVLAFMERA